MNWAEFQDHSSIRKVKLKVMFLDKFVSSGVCALCDCHIHGHNGKCNALTFAILFCVCKIHNAVGICSDAVREILKNF